MAPRTRVQPQADTDRYRDPAQIAGLWEGARLKAGALATKVEGPFWETLESLDIVLLVTREYEHLALSLTGKRGRPRVGLMQVPHPSGVAIDPKRGLVHLASTRNPNVVFDLAPVGDERLLVPVSARFLPGSTYLHDLALVGDRLLGCAVGSNAIVDLTDDARPVWWPASLDHTSGPRLDKNYLQLNSIAAGRTLEDSYFSASAAEPGRKRPGDPTFPVDKRGVIFSGRTREPIAHGLTRPHSARLFDDQLWVNNSGYGEIGFIRGGKFHPALKLPGWTRGLCRCGNILFVGTSRILPRFERYAPGLDPRKARCGIHAVDYVTGKVITSLYWPAGNQLFAIEAVPRSFTAGFAFTPESGDRERKLFYSYRPPARRDD